MELRTKKILPETFAKIIDHSATWVRVSMQRGLLPIGVAMKMNDRSKRWSYDIRPNLAANYLGISINELYDLINRYERREDI